MSGPHAAGAAAVFYSIIKAPHQRVPSPALVKAALINSAMNWTKPTAGPGPILTTTKAGAHQSDQHHCDNYNVAPRYYQYLDSDRVADQQPGLRPHIFVQGSDQPLKITLVYTMCRDSGRAACAGE